MANWTTSRITSSKIGVSNASSIDVAPRSPLRARPCPYGLAGIPSPAAGRDAVRGLADLVPDDRSDRDGDGGQDAGDDGPLDGGRAAAAVGLGTQAVEPGREVRPQIDEDRVMEGVERFHRCSSRGFFGFVAERQVMPRSPSSRRGTTGTTGSRRTTA